MTASGARWPAAVCAHCGAVFWSQLDRRIANPERCQGAPRHLWESFTDAKGAAVMFTSHKAFDELAYWKGKKANRRDFKGR